MPNPSLNMLLASGSLENSWIKQFQSSLAELGSLNLVQKPQLLEQLRQTNYDILILDETQLLGDYTLIQQALQVQPAVRVIVATNSPDWRRARQAFQYGAVDYITTSVSPEELIEIIREA